MAESRPRRAGRTPRSRDAVSAVAAAAVKQPSYRRVPAELANRQLAESTRLVADVPRAASATVVWTLGEAELLVQTDQVRLSCAPGLVTMAVPVTCDELEGTLVPVPVPLAVGAPNAPRGLLTATFDRLAGPEVVTALWSEAIAAFAWEVLLHLAGTVAAAAGKDRLGRPLVPGAIAADRGVLLVQPMARHDLT